MKKHLLFLCALLIASSFFAQESSYFKKDITPQITGKLIGFDSKIDSGLTLEFVCVVPTPEHQEENVVVLESDGSFTFTLDYALRYQQIWFSIGDYYFGQLLVDKGLTISADLTKLKETEQQFSTENIDFGGPDGALTHFMNQYVSFDIANRGASNPTMELMMNQSLSPAEKVTKLREIFAEKAMLEAKFLEATPLPYAWILENERLSELYGNMAVIYWGKEMPDTLLQEIYQHEPRLVSNSAIIDYYGYVGIYLLTPNEKERLIAYQEVVFPIIRIPEEKERLKVYLELCQKRIAGQDYDKTLYAKEGTYFFNQYKKEVNTANIKAFATELGPLPMEKADLLILVGGGKDIWEREAYVKILLPKVKTPWCAELMEKEWEITRKKILMVNEKLKAIRIPVVSYSIGKSRGILPNGAELFLSEQAELDTLLAAIRSSYPQKAIILDVWATWCGPCIYDMKNSAENLAKLKEMGVEVVYVCVASGTTEEGWRKKVTELDLSTKHLYLNEQLSDRIMDYFELSGYPSHVLLDKNGGYHPEVVQSIRDVDFEALKKAINE